ncbi:MAG: wax ester/triacylglycerol synthase family O-acyltransferase, partial [Nitriliruptorales bacterium]|nr:wax ester/triacylglycerol synthase family O-acyltransferase [Nitriliruptorales bacterium]
MALMPPQDAMFLYAERRQQPTHVGGLQLFTTPEGAGPDWLSEQYWKVLEQPVTDRRFTRRARRSPTALGQWEWVDDDAFDAEYHVRHSAIARPGRIRELLALTSRLHGNLLDRRRPLWEANLIEGLDDGRFAVYTKVHHAMVDGVAAMRLLQDTLSEDPDDRDVRMPWSREIEEKESRPGPGLSPSRLFQMGYDVISDAFGVTAATVTSILRSLEEEAATLPFQAPNSMLNVPITGARRFAAQSYEIDRMLAVKNALGITINDVVLAMSAGALRNHLLDLDALPDKPLIAMVPVSLRSADEAGAGGNSVGLILCNLG